MKERRLENMIQQLVDWFECAESGDTEQVIAEVSLAIEAIDEGRANPDPWRREQLLQLLNFLHGDAEDPEKVAAQYLEYREFLDFVSQRDARIRMEGFAHIAKVRAEQGELARARRALQRAREWAEIAGMTDSPKLLEAITAVEG